MKAAAIVVLLAALGAAALTARLGVWQLDRAAQKTGLQSALDRQRALPPLGAADLARRADDVPPQLHRAARVQGRWFAERTVYLENRQMNGRPGFFVLTPLMLDDGAAVLVQRGWWPRDASDRTRIAAPPAPPGQVQLLGRVAAGASRLYELGPAASAPGAIRHNLDLVEFARETRLPLLPLVLLQEDVAGEPALADGLLRQWPAPAADVHKHYGYAFQWFALCALVLGLYVWFQLIRPRRQRH